MLTQTLVTVFYAYLGVGAVFGLYFVSRGAARIDPAAHQLPILLRLLLWPASVALWPVLLPKLWKATSAEMTPPHSETTAP